ncbi:MAG: hypothetical protein WCA46_25105 [Actinocatenispora sp.]
MRDWRLRRRCEAIADDLPIPEPFSVTAFAHALAAPRGRPIELVPVAGWHTAPSGMLVSTDQVDYVLYAADTTELHQQHIVLHELGHLLCGHVHQSTVADAVAALLPDLSTDLIRRVLGRATYDRAEEREAEMMAAVILRRAHHAKPVNGEVSSELSAGLARLRVAFDTPARRRSMRD